jgi:hypothetical protein
MSVAPLIGEEYTGPITRSMAARIPTAPVATDFPTLPAPVPTPTPTPVAEPRRRRAGASRRVAPAPTPALIEEPTPVSPAPRRRRLIMRILIRSGEALLHTLSNICLILAASN